MDYSWTTYRYGYNDPISFTDPDGLWEFRINGNRNDGYYLTLNWQKGDNLNTLSEQTGYSVDEIKGFYDESTIKTLEAGDNVQLSEFGGIMEGINEALNESLTTACNCWGTALEFGETGKVDPMGGIKHPTNADKRLQKNFTETNKPKTGDVLRYATENAYKDVDFNRDGRIDIKDEIIRQREKLSGNGNETGGTSHFATFLLKNDQGTQVFTKNGWYDKWTISYERNLPSSYGNQKGINGGSSIYTLKK